MIKSRKIHQITLIYDTIQNQNIEEIAAIIELNPTLLSDYQGKILSLVQIEEKNIIFINDFNSFFQVQIQSLLNSKQFMSIVKSEDILCKLYLTLITQKEKNLLEDDTVFAYIATRYYIENKDWNKFVHSLKTHDNQLELENFLKDSGRFPAYCYYLKMINNEFNQQDFIFFDYFEEIFSKVLIDISKINIEKDFPLESDNELEKLFFNFFQEIHVPNNWYSLYQQLKEKKGITKKKDIASCCYLDETDNQLKININSEGLVDSFITLVHEFTHYISLQKMDYPRGLVEFPAIFFEKLAAQYLIKIGYSKKTVDAIASFRNENNALISMMFHDIIIDVQKYHYGEPITLEKKVEKLKELLANSESLKEKLDQEPSHQNFSLLINFLEKGNDDYKKIVKNNIERDILLLYQKSESIMSCYQYLIGNHLADLLLERSLTQSLPKMFNLVNHFSKFNLSFALKYLEMEDIWKNKQNKEKKLKKKN